MDAFWIVLDIAMTVSVCVYAVRHKDARVFATVQWLQGLEIPILALFPGWRVWSSIDLINLPLELVALMFGNRFRWSQVLIILHLAAKLHWWDHDLDWQLGDDFWRYWLNKAVTVSILLYTFPMPKRKHHDPPAPKPSPKPADVDPPGHPHPPPPPPPSDQ